jgi:hypothetical protein
MVWLEVQTATAMSVKFHCQLPLPVSLTAKALGSQLTATHCQVPLSFSGTSNELLLANS